MDTPAGLMVGIRTGTDCSSIVVNSVEPTQERRHACYTLNCGPLCSLPMFTLAATPHERGANAHARQALFAITMYIGSPPPKKPLAGDISFACGAVQPPGTLLHQHKQRSNQNF